MHTNTIRFSLCVTLDGMRFSYAIRYPRYTRTVFCVQFINRMAAMDAHVFLPFHFATEFVFSSLFSKSSIHRIDCYISYGFHIMLLFACRFFLFTPFFSLALYHSNDRWGERFNGMTLNVKRRIVWWCVCAVLCVVIVRMAFSAIWIDETEIWIYWIRLQAIEFVYHCSAHCCFNSTTHTISHHRHHCSILHGTITIFLWDKSLTPAISAK